MHNFACRNRGKASQEFEAQVEDMSAPIPRGFMAAVAQGPEGNSPYGGAPAGGSPAAGGAMRPSQIATLPRPAFQPVPVFVGPVAGWTGPIAHAEGDTATAVKQAYTADGEAEADSPVKPAPDAQSMRAKRGSRPKAKVARVQPAKPVAAKSVAAKAVAAKADDDEDEKPAKAKPAKTHVAKVHDVKTKDAGKAKAKRPAKSDDDE